MKAAFLLLSRVAWAVIYGIVGIAVGAAIARVWSLLTGDPYNPDFQMGFWAAVFIYRVGRKRTGL